MTIRAYVTALIEQGARYRAPIREDADLYADLGFDSLSFMNLLIDIEEACSIEFGLMEMGECLKAGRLIALAEEKAGEAGYDTRLVEGA